MSNVASLENQAIEFAKRGDFGASARSVNEELTRAQPANQGAWTRLARCCMELGLFDDATAALDAALQLNPQNTIARNLQVEVTKRRAGPAADVPASRRRATSGPRTSTAAKSASARSSRTAVTTAGIGRAEFTALGHLPAPAAAEALTARLEPLLMALNERPFAAKVVEARNRAGHAGARLFRRGSLQPVAQGHINVYQQGGRWEPQLNIGLFSSAQWRRDSVCAGIGFNLAEEGGGDKSDAGRERVVSYFQAFQQQLSTKWRQHLTDWMRANAGFIQYADSPPEIDVLPYDAVDGLIGKDNPAELGWVFVGRWLFADRGEDVGILTDGPRLIKWIEQTFADLLPLWGSVYREKYLS